MSEAEVRGLKYLLAARTLLPFYVTALGLFLTYPGHRAVIRTLTRREAKGSKHGLLDQFFPAAAPSIGWLIGGS